MKHRIPLLCLAAVCCLSGQANAQDVAPSDFVVPPPRTITAPLKPQKLAKTVEIMSFEEGMVCNSVFTLSASRKEIHPGETVTFRSSIQRKCNDKAAKAPVPVSVAFSVRSTGKKPKTENSQTSQPTASASSFTHTFEKLGTYQVTVIHAMNDVETHTVTLNVQVVPPKDHAPASES